jgi:hypothetical protein
MVEGVAAPPEIVGRQRQDANDAPDPVIRTTTVEERPVAAIGLNHKETHEEAGSRDREQQAAPIAGAERGRHQGPNDCEGHGRDRKFHHAPRGTRLAIACERKCPRPARPTLGFQIH